MKKRIIASFFCGWIVLALTGCTVGEEEKAQKVRDLEYTVVKEREIPQDLVEVIETKKAEKFKVTYTDNEYLYISYGYGQQETGGYSISVKDLYESDNAIYFSVEVHGPKRGEEVSQGSSYPYIVVKTEALDLPVVFE